MLGALIFFIVTNFGVWSLGSYGYTWEGLISCYVLALPFFGNTLVGTMIFSLVIEKSNFIISIIVIFNVAIFILPLGIIGSKVLSSLEYCTNNQLENILVKVRSTGKMLKADINLLEKNEAEVNLLNPENGISPGQACVFYKKDQYGHKVLGGGWIKE